MLKNIFLLFFVFTSAYSQITLEAINNHMMKNGDILSEISDFDMSIIKGAYYSNIKRNKSMLNKGMGYKGGSLSGITTRQIPGASRLFKTNVNSVVLLVDPAGTGVGSGAIISKDGDIITNWHVVNGNEKMLVGFYNKQASKLDDLDPESFAIATVIGVDVKRDLALVKLDEGNNNYKPLIMGSPYSLEIAQDVFAIGHPENLIWSFSYGVISQIRNQFEWPYADGSSHIANVIQTQTPINPGNSGGPLFNEKGKLIGINTFKSHEGVGLNFAVNIGEVKSFYKDIKAGLYKPELAPNMVSEWKPLDVNENGITDGYVIKVDDLIIVQVDKNEDETIEVTLMKFDDDENWSAELYDKDGDGFFEYWLLDLNENGKRDNAAIDTDKDGVPDYFL